MDKKFWKGKRVLVTGYEGFLGSNLTHALLRLGVTKVVGLDLKPSQSNAILSAEDYKSIFPVQGSVADFSLVKDLMLRHKIQIVFHLAAEAIVGECFAEPLRTFETNITGTAVVLEASRSADIEALIVASSDKAYGSQLKLPYREDTPLQGNHPYDVSKSCADLISYTYAHVYKTPVAVTRCGNIYGPGDMNFSRIVPDTMRCLYKKQKLLIRSDGKSIRDYIFVEDAVSGYLSLAENLKKKKLAGSAFNFSYDQPISVLSLIKQISRQSGGELNYTILNQAKYEIKRQYLSSSKARRILGWRPLIGLEKGIHETIDWYAVFLAKQEAV